MLISASDLASLWLHAAQYTTFLYSFDFVQSNSNSALFILHINFCVGQSIE